MALNICRGIERLSWTLAYSAEGLHDALQHLMSQVLQWYIVMPLSKVAQVREHKHQSLDTGIVGTALYTGRLNL